MAAAEPNDEALRAGVAAVDITGGAAEQTDNPLYARIDAARAADRLYARALVLTQGETAVVLVSVDAVAVAEIGTIGNDFLPRVRAELAETPGIPPAALVVNATHCHGVVCADVASRTVEAVRQAWSRRVPVRAAAGQGSEDGIQENRRLRLRGGGEADVRRAYSLPPDAEIEAVGPIDPAIGVLRLDTLDGHPLAAVFHFACHPIQGVPSGANTADLSGFAARTVEAGLPGATALFLQGCAADINPVRYRDVGAPPDAEPLGRRLGQSALEALLPLGEGQPGPLRLVRRVVSLPRADLAPRIAELEAEQASLLARLTPTPLNLKTFVPLLIQQRLAPETPSYDGHLYLHEEARGRADLRRHDEEIARQLEAYTANVHTMEALTRLRVNLDLLRMHQARNEADGSGAVDAEVVGLRVGDFVLVAFPGELPVELGLRIKGDSPHAGITCVSGVTNGYLYYTPTARQLANRGGAQEDSDCFVDAAWEPVFVDAARSILRALTDGTETPGC